MLALGLALILISVLGIVFAAPHVVHAETTTIDTLEVAFKKAGVGDSLAYAMDFEDKTAKTLKVPKGANYTATLKVIWKDGQKQQL